MERSMRALIFRRPPSRHIDIAERLDEASGTFVRLRRRFLISIAHHAALFGDTFSRQPALLGFRIHSPCHCRRSAPHLHAGHDDAEFLLAALDRQRITDPNMRRRTNRHAVQADFAVLDRLLCERTRFEEARRPKPDVQPHVAMWRVCRSVRIVIRHAYALSLSRRQNFTKIETLGVEGSERLKELQVRLRRGAVVRKFAPAATRYRAGSP